MEEDIQHPPLASICAPKCICVYMFIDNTRIAPHTKLIK